MTVYDFITKHPDEHIRVIRYVPAPDVIDKHGNLSCGGEGTSTIVFDSTTGEGNLSGLLLYEVINSPEDEMTPEDLTNPDHIYELEYMPEEFWC